MSKEKIIKIATQEFATYGYDGVSMNTLASKLEVNKATIYYHFKHKKSLYQDVLKSIIKINTKEVKGFVKENLFQFDAKKLFIFMSNRL